VVSVTFDRPAVRADELGATQGSVRFIEIPAHRFVMVDGEGPPGGEAFTQRLPGMYGTAYKLRFALKAAGTETKVGSLEGVWWTESGETDLDRILSSDREGWRWTLLIALPDDAADDQVEDALQAGRAKVRPAIAANLRVESFAEGRVAQTLHVGPYTTERPTIERLHAAIHEAGLQERGRHHELYLGDPQRSAPERLRTVLRHPVVDRSVADAAGGLDGLRRLAGAWHARVMADEVVSHAFSHGFHPQHTVRLAAYWAEALGGPTAYSDAYGDETSVVRMHSGNGVHEEMDRRAIACFDEALADVGLAHDERLRQVLHDYFAWATTTSMARFHESAADVPDGLRIPRWTWDGLVE